MTTKLGSLNEMLKKLTKQKKIVVTGSRGFIGTHLMRALPNAVGWDIRDGKDIFSPEFMEETKDADVIIHLAAQVSVSQSIKDPEFTLALNTKGTLRVLLAAEQNRAKVIFPSSASVYKIVGRTAIRETDELEVNNPYGQSKIECEYLCAAFRYRLTIVVFRFFNIYGFNPTPQDDSVINRFLNGVQDKKLVIHGDGTQVRDFVSIVDIVQVILEAIKNPDFEGKFINVGSGVGTSMNKLAEIFKKASRKKNIEVVYENTDFGVKSAVADIQVLKSIYKRPLLTSLERDIKANL